MVRSVSQSFSERTQGASVPLAYRRKGAGDRCWECSFFCAFGYPRGVEPAEAMARIAEEKGILVHRGVAEELPLQHESFDKILVVMTVCFLKDPKKAFQEAWRVLRERGIILIGLLDKASPFGERLLERQKKRILSKCHFPLRSWSC